MSYNVKKALSKIRFVVAETPKIILFVVVFLAAILISVFRSASADTEGASACEMQVDLYLEAVSAEDGYVDIALVNHNGALCGVLAELVCGTAYEPIAVSLGADACEDACLTYRDDGGRVTFALDSLGGVGEGEILLFRFALVDAREGKCAFELRGGYGRAAVCDGEDIQKAYLSDKALVLGGCEEQNALPLSANVTVSDGGAELYLSARVEEYCNFIGFDVTVTDIYGGHTQRFTVAGKALRENDGAYGICLSAPIPGGSCSIVVRRICYGKDDDTGAEAVYLLLGDKLCFVNDRAN